MARTSKTADLGRSGPTESPAAGPLGVASARLAAVLGAATAVVGREGGAYHLASERSDGSSTRAASLSLSLYGEAEALYCWYTCRTRSVERVMGGAWPYSPSSRAVEAVRAEAGRVLPGGGDFGAETGRERSEEFSSSSTASPTCSRWLSWELAAESRAKK